MEEFNYPTPVIDLDKYKISKKEIKMMEKEINTYELKQKICIKGHNINTIGELKKYIKNYEIIEKLYNFLDEEDYVYIYKWFQKKENGYFN